MRKSLTFLLVLGVLLAAGEAPRVQLRYQPAPQSAWESQGRLVVTTTLATETATETQEVAWTDLVTAVDAAGTREQTRTIKRWVTVGTQENLAPREPVRMQVSSLAEQTRGGVVDQPALYPLRNVAVGESWPIERVTTGPVLVESDLMQLTSRTVGTGTLVGLDPKVASLQLRLVTETSGSAGTVATRSRSEVTWTMDVDRAEGVPISQKAQTVTTQTVMVGETVIPSRTETLLELTTRRAP